MIKGLLAACFAALCMLSLTACSGLRNCSGNACSDVDLTDWEYHTPGTAIKSVVLRNYGNNRVQYSVYWAGIGGNCSVRNDGVVQPGGASKINNALAVYLGVCKVTANYS